MKVRRKTYSVQKEFLSEIRRLRTFDADNQKKFSANKHLLTKQEIHLLTESIFFTLFRDYENFIRDIFLLYSRGNQYYGRKKIVTYLTPKNFTHTEQLIQSSMKFLDWNDPDTLITRSELYLENGFPIKTLYSVNLNTFQQYKRIRNHIAHNSTASLNGYKKVLRDYYGTVPLTIPLPGAFLLLSDKSNPSKYLLLSFFDFMENLGKKSCNLNPCYQTAVNYLNLSQ